MRHFSAANLDPSAPPPGASPAEIMAHRLATVGGAKLYGLRKQTPDPVFGIIKRAIGFRRFHLRGLEEVAQEWTRITTACILKRRIETAKSLNIPSPHQTPSYRLSPETGPFPAEKFRQAPRILENP